MAQGFLLHHLNSYIRMNFICAERVALGFALLSIHTHVRISSDWGQKSFWVTRDLNSYIRMNFIVAIPERSTHKIHLNSYIRMNFIGKNTMPIICCMVSQFVHMYELYLSTRVLENGVSLSQFIYMYELYLQICINAASHIFNSYVFLTIKAIRPSWLASQLLLRFFFNLVRTYRRFFNHFMFAPGWLSLIPCSSIW